MTSSEVLNSKNKIYDKIKSITDFKAIWEYNSQTKACRLVIEGIYMEKGMGPSGLTAADKEWIANLVVTTVKPIREDISEIKDRLDALEEDMKNVKEDIGSLKKDVKAIKECPTIKKEIK